jgi:hypothetical protein
VWVGNESYKRTRFLRRGRKVLRETERWGPITECRVKRGFVYIYRKLGWWSGRVGGQWGRSTKAIEGWGGVGFVETELLLTREALRIRLIPIAKSKQGYACLFNTQKIVEVIWILGELGGLLAVWSTHYWVSNEALTRWISSQSLYFYFLVYFSFASHK